MIDLELISEIRSHAALKTYLAIAAHANAEGEAWPSIATLAKITAIKERSVSRALRELELGGSIATFDRSSTLTSLYVVQPNPVAFMSTREPGDPANTFFAGVESLWYDCGVEVRVEPRKGRLTEPDDDDLRQVTNKLIEAGEVDDVASRDEARAFIETEIAKQRTAPRINMVFVPVYTREIDAEARHWVDVHMRGFERWASSRLVPWSVMLSMLWYVKAHIIPRGEPLPVIGHEEIA